MYKLLKNEIKELDKFWEFIELFQQDLKLKDIKKKDFLYDCKDYRINLINKIRTHYTARDFYKYEKILNKLLHNLINHLTIDIDKLDSNKCSLYEKGGKRSFSHKQYLYNEKTKQYYYFTEYQHINNYPIINKLFYILSDRLIYEKVMKNKKNRYQLKPSTYYYPLDYPFPNINLLFYNENSSNDWLSRINQMYYQGETQKTMDKGWYEFGFR